MLDSTKRFLKSNIHLSDEMINIGLEVEDEIKKTFQKIDDIKEYNQYKVLKAMQDSKISDIHFNWNTGYGYDDIGRDAVERVYASLFKTEDAIVRPIIVSGTHALTLCLSGILRPGDELIYATGKPYDTLEEVIGIRGKDSGSLAEFGVTYKQVNLKNDGSVNLEELKKSISNKTKMVCIQRSTGYDWRKALTINDIKEIVDTVKSIRSDLICMADNCYGEFLDILEPTEVGIDIMAGSLIKNPGGGLALTGGYIVGKKELIRLISYRMTSPGIGKECGLTFGLTRSMLQGLFIAPHVVSEAIKGSIFCARLFEKLGYEVCPKYYEERSDIIQSIKLGDAASIIAFCQGIQAAAPVDSFVKPEPWEMPGYDSPIIMAAGAFVQGSSIELSADAPIKEPYIVYYQGGLTYEHAKYGVLNALQTMQNCGCIKLG